MKTYLKLMFAGLLIFSISIINAQEISIVPKPVKINVGQGEFTFNETTKIEVLTTAKEEVNKVAEYLKDMLSASGYNFNIIKVKMFSSANVIQLNCAASNKLQGAEGYKISVTNQKVVLNSTQPAGLFYAVQTLRQLLPIQIEVKSNSKTLWKIPVVEIEDAPRFGWRGFMLDVGRYFYSKEDIKKFMDYMAFFKMNVFHFHLTEGAGWRIEIKKYPKLTSVGAWRANRDGVDWNDQLPLQPGEKNDFGGFYSQEDIKELIQYAKERAITIVPEIEMPGHSMAALVAYPELSCTGGPFEMPTGGVNTRLNNFCAGKDKTFEFLTDVLSEVIQLFPSDYIHIGGDEADKDLWKKCPDCQARIKKEKLKDEDELQSYFIKRIEKFLLAKKKKLIGWDEILEGGLAKSATVMPWRGEKPGVEAAKAGQDLIMTPKFVTYLDYTQGLDLEPVSIKPQATRLINLEYAYNYEPVMKELNAEETKHVLGIQGNLWTEHVSEIKKAEYMSFPRLIALAEVAWTSKENKDYLDFTERMKSIYDRMDLMKINYRKPDLLGYYDRNVFIDDMSVKIIPTRNGSTIRYTLDELEPDASAQIYREPIHLTKPATIIAREFLPDGRFARAKKGVFVKQTPIKSVQLTAKESGLVYNYYETKCNVVADLEKVQPVKTEIKKNFELPDQFLDNKWGTSYTGYIEVPDTGVYTFYTESNDGSALFIHNQKVVDNDFGHPQKLAFGQIALEKGLHPIKVLYFDVYQDEVLKVYFSGPGFERKPVPSEILFYTK